MRLSKKIVLISTFISIVTVLASVLINVNNEKNEIIVIFDNILQNIFAGTIVLVITSLYEYLNIKKETIEDILLHISELKKMFGKIEYFDGRDFVSFELFNEYYKDKFSKEEIEDLYNISKEEYYIKQQKKFEIIINDYIQIAEKDYSSFWNCYKKIDFILDKGNKEKYNIYYQLFDYIYYYKVKKIREKVWHFKEYIKAENKEYYEVNKNFLTVLQQEIFCYDEINLNEFDTFEQFTISENEVDFCSWGEDSLRNVYYIVGNKVTKHLGKVYDYIYNKFYYKDGKKEKMKIKYTNEPISYEDYNEITERVGYKIRKREIVEDSLNNTLFSITAYDKNRIIGYTRIIGDKPIAVYIQDIIVIPEYQGKNVEKQILEKLLIQIDKYKRIYPHIKIYLETKKEKEKFYEKYGFEIKSIDEREVEMVLKNKTKDL